MSRSPELARSRAAAWRSPGTALLATALAVATLAGGCGGDMPLDGPEQPQRTVTLPEGGQSPDAVRGAKEVEIDTGDCPNAMLEPDEENRRAVESATLCLVNLQRSRRDIDGLSDDRSLREAARAKARHMVEKNYFAHVGPDGRDVRDWVGETDYLDGGGFQLGENLGWASEGAATPAQLVQGWMDSPSHRRNILREQFEDSGLGVVLGAPREAGGGGATYVHVFGAR